MPSPTDYEGQSSFWSSINDLVDGIKVTAEMLYKKGLRRLFDRGEWLKDEITRKAAALASTSLGTRAKLTGSVDLSTLTYDGTSGTLNGKTLELESDSSGPIEVEFGTGGSAPTGPADVVQAIIDQSGEDIYAEIDAAGHLSVYSITTGSDGTIEIAGGTAVDDVGLPTTMDEGEDSEGDGLALVGGAVITGSQITLSSGTLRAMLLQLANAVGLLSGSQTFTGAKTFNNITVSSGNDYKVSSRSRTRVQTKPAYNPTTRLVATHLAAQLVQDQSLWQPVLVPNGATITGWSITIDPPAHGGGMPDTRVQGYLAKLKVGAGATGTEEQVGSIEEDPNTADVDYDPTHSFGATGMSEVVDRSAYRYYIAILGEQGTNDEDVVYVGASVTYTVTKVDESY